ncbi:MAG TPA: hypothetical protein VHM02_04045, partial [Thermoanaerobaculia bacterium]|nr:hypothetical protein [Thermoanaerobaculia bacterium]
GRLAVVLVATAATAIAAAAGAAPQSEPAAPATQPEAAFGETVDVRLSAIRVRVVDSRGEPIRGLGPDDFLVAVGDTRVPVRAVDFEGVADEAPAAPPPAGEPAAEEPSAATAAEPVAPNPPRPALVVLFLQADFNAVRVRGHLKMLPFVEKLLAALPADDRVAVVSFDSRLELWQDFSRDRAATREAVWGALRFGTDPPPLPPPAPDAPSIAAAWDDAAARRAAQPERALELVARAVEPLPGEKRMVFLGWGLGRWGSSGFRMGGDYREAARALWRAGVPVFVLDVTQADSHTLELGLRRVAAETGGTYEKTYDFPLQATARLARTLTSRYVLHVDPADLPAAGGEVHVEVVGHPEARLLLPAIDAVPAAAAPPVP